MARADQSNSEKTTFYASLDAKGRIVLPLGLRKRAQVETGDVLTITLDHNRTLHINPTQKKSSSLKGFLKSKKQTGSIVTDFISERRREALLDD
jgi:bifunctional DNA-binding transcriptional regulator/antitoxin component of YhaV-PrlF toxin-antitoxin module